MCGPPSSTAGFAAAGSGSGTWARCFATNGPREVATANSTSSTWRRWVSPAPTSTPSSSCSGVDCGGGWGYPFPFPFPSGGFGGGFCGTTTVVQPAYPVGQELAGAPIADEQLAAGTLDLELLEVRQLDRGDAAKQLGPAYRLMLRNRTGEAIGSPFNVALAASIGREPTADSAFAVQRIEGLQAGQTLTVELRLPAKAYAMGQNADGQSVPFAYLTAVVDSHQELPESDRENDYMVLERGAIVMVAAK